MKKFLTGLIAGIAAVAMVVPLAACGGDDYSESDAMTLLADITTDTSTLTAINVTETVESDTETIVTTTKYRSKAYSEVVTYSYLEEVEGAEGAETSYKTVTETTSEHYLFTKDSSTIAYERDFSNETATEATYTSYTIADATYLTNYEDSLKANLYEDYEVPESESQILSISKSNTTYTVTYKVGSTKYYTVKFSAISKLTEVLSGAYRLSYIKIKDSAAGTTTTIEFEYPSVSTSTQGISEPSTENVVEEVYNWIDLTLVTVTPTENEEVEETEENIEGEENTPETSEPEEVEDEEENNETEPETGSNE